MKLVGGFTPANQNKVVIQLIRECKALTGIEAGRIVLPIVLLSLLWMRNEFLEDELVFAHKLHYDYVAQVSIGVAEQQATLIEQARQAEIIMDETRKNHLATISHLQDFYNEKIKADIAPLTRTGTDLRSQLRIALDAEAYVARRPADPNGYIERTTGGGGKQ
ncbi:lysozyme family protein [Methylobacillus arboreus]|uniref:hypothetical protein n=1 Tax=Methylobacillus arboreus TaxID=755170 RepID=UPI001E33775B|nr:hypothetical protein [Methylobacillus arboreus]